MKFRINDALLHSDFNQILQPDPRPLSRVSLSRGFATNVIRVQTGAGTLEDPTVYGAPTTVFGGFYGTDKYRSKYSLALAFNGTREAGSNPYLLAIAGISFRTYQQSATAFLALMKFLINKNLLDADFSDVTENIKNTHLRGQNAVEAFEAIHARSIEIVREFVQ